MIKKSTLLPIVMVLVAAPLLQAQVTIAGSWFAESSIGADVTNTSSGSTVNLQNISGGFARIGAVAGLSQTVSLNSVGDFIQVVGTYSGAVGNNTNYSIRVGFFDASGLTIDTDYDVDMDSLIGNYAALGTRSGTGARTAIFSQPSNSDQVLALNQATPPNMLGSFVTDTTTGTRTVTYRVERIVGDLLQFSLNDGANINIARTLAVASASTLDFDSIAVGFALANNGSASFSDMVITTIPEPSTYAVLVGLGVLGLAVRRRMRR